MTNDVDSTLQMKYRPSDGFSYKLRLGFNTRKRKARGKIKTATAERKFPCKNKRKTRNRVDKWVY